MVVFGFISAEVVHFEFDVIRLDFSGLLDFFGAGAVIGTADALHVWRFLQLFQGFCGRGGHHNSFVVLPEGL